MKSLKIYIYIFCFQISQLLMAQEQTGDSITLETVVLKASVIPKPLIQAAASIASITTHEITKTDGVIITPLLNNIPGISMQQGNLNTNRIIIRGIGSRSQYSSNRIKAYFEDIPISTAEGETVIEDMEMSALQKIEIYKGPNSTSFGAGLGGVIALYGKDQALTTNQVESTTTIGSFGLFKQNISGGYTEDQTTLYANFTHLESHGFRENSGYKRQNLNLFGTHKITANHQLSFVGIHTKLKAYIPSSISLFDFENNPTAAATNWAQAKGYESYSKSILGIGYTWKINDHFNFKSSIFSNTKDAYEPRPFDILDENVFNYGNRTTLNYRNKIFKMSIGTEILFENYNYTIFENLYQSNEGQGSLQGEAFNAAKQLRNYQNYFVEMNLMLHRQWLLETGVSFNKTFYKQRYTMHTSPAESFSFESIWSPRIGLSYLIKPEANIYASISHGFSIPAVAETLTPEGSLNQNLIPEIGLNYEIGFKGYPFSFPLYFAWSLYQTDIKNLLVARRTAEDQYVGINAGSSKHQGIETSAHYSIQLHKQWFLKPNINASIHKFIFDQYIDEDVNYSGNFLPGVPFFQWNNNLELSSTKGFSFSLSNQNTGKIALNDNNDGYSKPFQLVHLHIGQRFTILKKFELTVRGGVNNLMDTNYAASILPNAIGFGQTPARFYYPGMPRNYYISVQLHYQF